MTSNLNNHKKQGLVLLAFILFGIAPDLLYSLFSNSYQAGQNPKGLLALAVLMILTAYTGIPRLSKFLLCLYAVMQSTQIMYYHYFGTFYSAFDLILFLTEYTDTFLAFFDLLPFLLLPFALCIVFFIPAFWLYQRNHSAFKRSYPTSIILVVALLIPFAQALKSDSSEKFQPNLNKPAVHNALFAHSYFMANQTMKALGKNHVQTTHYQTYQKYPIAPTDANIVVIMGESLSSLNMGLFGYERKTNPRLEDYKNDPLFFYRPSISSGMSTRVSLALFFNTVYEPNNISHLHNMETGLFKLAKQSGFATHYISTQRNTGVLGYSFSKPHIDTWLEYQDMQDNKLYPKPYDERLLQALKNLNLDYSKPQFITLHMRSTHAPYVDNYPAEQEVYPVDRSDYHSYLRNSYDNSVLYTEALTADIFEYFKATQRPTYVFFTSDHGELTGQNNKYGHAKLEFDIAKVPFLFYGANLKTDAVEQIKNDLGPLPNHYIISKKIAELLGYKIHNPNEEDDTFYINGISAFGEAGYIKYSLQEQVSALEKQ